MIRWMLPISSITPRCLLVSYRVYTLISVWFNRRLTFFIDNMVSHLLSDLIPPGACSLLNPSTIYANNEVCLAEVDIYGFDYDYTLALYSNALNTMIFNTARSFLIEHYKVRLHVCHVGVGALTNFKNDFLLFPPWWQYPEGIGKYDYIPNFAVRGLHYDIQKVRRNTKMLLQKMFAVSVIKVCQSCTFVGSFNEDRCLSLHSAGNSVSVRF